jgi:hypothetical protein
LDIRVACPEIRSGGGFGWAHEGNIGCAASQHERTVVHEWREMPDAPGGGKVGDLPANELWRRINARNAAPPWDSQPISRADLDGWLRVFQAPDPAELALFDPPWQNQS